MGLFKDTDGDGKTNFQEAVTSISGLLDSATGTISSVTKPKVDVGIDKNTMFTILGAIFGGIILWKMFK